MTAADDLALDERVALIADRYEAAQLEVSGWGAVVLEPAPNGPTRGGPDGSRVEHLRPARPDDVVAGPRLFTIAEARLRHQESLEYLPILGADGHIVHGWSHLVAGWWRLGKSELLAAAILPWLRRGLLITWVTEEADSIWSDRADAFEELYEPVPWEGLTSSRCAQCSPGGAARLRGKPRGRRRDRRHRAGVLRHPVDAGR